MKHRVAFVIGLVVGGLLGFFGCCSRCLETPVLASASA